MNAAFYGIPVGALVVLVVEVLKRIDPTKYAEAKPCIIAALIAGGVLGILLAISTGLATFFSFDQVMSSLLGCLLSALASMGLYDVSRTGGYKSNR
jgi:H+/Cl- antiporter ClcA